MTVTIQGLAVELHDGVRETTQTTGTGTYQLDGAAVVSGQTYRTFVSAAVGDRVPYVVWFGNQFERGLGTVTAGAPPTITRSVILGSSNSNNPVSWGAGVKDIWLDAPSELLDQINAPAGSIDDGDITAAASATNYTPTSATVQGHLAGIDTALAPAGSIDDGDVTAAASATNYTPTSSTVQGHLAGIDTALAPGAQVDSVVSMKPTTFTSSGTFTRDANCLFAIVRMVGGGGGGGGTEQTFGGGDGANGGGGGGGEYAEGRFTAATIGTSRTVTIGGGGSVSSAGNGGTGGTTSFSSLLTAVGGSGGTAGSSTSGSTNAPGGDGGSGGTGGHFRRRGDDGGRGRVLGGIAVLTGYGGASALGGSRQASDSTGSLGGRTYGGGGTGAGATSSDGARSGGVGAAGVVIIEEYLHP